ncbi:acyl-CoA Delta-9 desaturase-like [Chrysoperla carnea]|uniref:acyl-CoA Delta-9 desaturase-like n=1 Tax=Chrysoperla carnea TaxID=189513 RepID=UPI001D08B51F|nr:acyl-CoA Delta-9 desaturase-like [Chrysoperla carnea]
MAPNNSNCSEVLNEDNLEFEHQNELKPELEIKSSKYKMRLVWRNIILFLTLHLASVYGIYLIFTSAKLITTIYAIFLYQAGAFGITAGAHRLWTHRAYKAKWPLKLLLIICDTLAFQDAVIDWARDHRMHHKFSETDADPHNAKRGFFFCHMGWLLCRKHPEVKEKGKSIDLSDLSADPFIRFQKRYYLILMPLVCFVLPTLIPWYFWNESLLNSWFVASLWRYTVTLHVTWLVNSVAHLWGARPYDKTINPVENLFVSLFALGEGWHNYHHTFPWDYKAAEIGHWRINVTTHLINFFAKIGWAYDLKTVSDDMIQKRVLRTGDGTHPFVSNYH